jgi:hypothetical protein
MSRGTIEPRMESIWEATILQWRNLGKNRGPPKVEFCTSEGIAPNFPTAGKVVTEAVIEAIDEEAPPGYPGGSS